MNEGKYDFSSEFSRNSADFHHFRRVRFRLALAKQYKSSYFDKNGNFSISSGISTRYIWLFPDISEV